MSTNHQNIIAVYLAGLLQGITLVAFPAASTIFTNAEAFNFSNATYGSLFIPQAIISIFASAFCMKLNKWYSSKSIFFWGLSANILAMVLLASSAFLMHSSWAYYLLLIATGFLGLGFGLTVPTLNSMAALLYPLMIDSTILILNALLGVGTALAPLLMSFFNSLGYWWGLPILLVILIGLLIFISLPLNLPGGNLQTNSRKTKTVIPNKFWIFAAFAFLYGIVETLNGNWSSIYMAKYENATMFNQLFALAGFWGMVTLGRIFFALIGKNFPAFLTYQILPFIIAIAFLILATFTGEGRMGILLFGIAGFGCSALLPLTISFANKQLPSIATTVAGGIIAFYLMGYGVAGFGTGSLLDSLNIGLKEIYAGGSIIALGLGILAFIMTKKRNYN